MPSKRLPKRPHPETSTEDIESTSANREFTLPETFSLPVRAGSGGWEWAEKLEQVGMEEESSCSGESDGGSDGEEHNDNDEDTDTDTDTENKDNSESEEEDELEDTNQNKHDNDDRKKHKKSTAEAKVDSKKSESMQEQKQKIASHSAAILAAPENNISQMSSLAAYADKKSKSKDLAIFSICAILKDIVPGYPIRLLTEKEKQQKMTKEVKHLHIYEEKLYYYYSNFIKILTDFGDSKHILTIVSMLLKAHPHFNFRKELVQLLLPYLSGANDLHLAACTTITDLFVTDELGSITGEILTPLLRKPITIPLLNALRAVKTYRLLVKEAKHKRKKFDKSKRTVDAEVDVEQRHKNFQSNTNNLLQLYFQLLVKPQPEMVSTLLQNIRKIASHIPHGAIDPVMLAVRDLLTVAPIDAVLTGYTLLKVHGDDERVDPVAFNTVFQQVLNDLPHLSEADLPSPQILSQLLEMHPNPKVDTLHLPLGHMLSIGLNRDWNASLNKYHYHPYVRNGIPHNRRYKHHPGDFVLQPRVPLLKASGNSKTKS